MIWMTSAIYESRKAKRTVAKNDMLEKGKAPCGWKIKEVDEINTGEWVRIHIVDIDVGDAKKNSTGKTAGNEQHSKNSRE
jgi:hypothetical protein